MTAIDSVQHWIMTAIDFVQQWTLIWGTIKENKDELGIVLTLLVVIVTWQYVRLTKRLARSANTSAQAALQQASAANTSAQAALEQASASRLNAEATALQARTTRQIFEVSHRPVVSLRIDPHSHFLSDDFYRLTFLLTNHGPIPAILRESSIVVTSEDGGPLVRATLPGQGVSIFQNDREETTVSFTEGSGSTSARPNPSVNILLVVTYTGFDDVVRRSGLGISGSSNNWTREHTEIH
jgi:hypothetical protein